MPEVTGNSLTSSLISSKIAPSEGCGGFLSSTSAAGSLVTAIGVTSSTPAAACAALAAVAAASISSAASGPSTGCQHEYRWKALWPISDGSSARHLSVTLLQRAANRQPDGG